MIVCGLKLTHDGAVALIDDNRLIFSIEIEKLSNNKRYSSISDINVVPDILKSFGYQLSDVDEWIIDGWDGITDSKVELLNNHRPMILALSPYHEGNLNEKSVLSSTDGEFSVLNRKFKYTSYMHVVGHIMSTYCTSSFSIKGEPSFVMIWDGGMFPRLYYVDPNTKSVESYGPFLRIIGHFYATAGHHFGPFKRDNYSKTADDLSVAGKLMAYIALGKANKEIISVFQEIYNKHFTSESVFASEYIDKIGGYGTSVEPSMKYVHNYFIEVRQKLNKKKFSDEDILTSMHNFLEELILESLVQNIIKWKGNGLWNLCLAGGCALNIKWNSAFRSNALFKDVWVPPFPNDSGSAIGTAFAFLFKEKGIMSFDWNARLGPQIEKCTNVLDGWESEFCSTSELSYILYDTNQPVLLLHSRAELGPRALGRRSIIATAISSEMKEFLNLVKNREYYRPVAPICLTEYASQIFNPGTPDPYMLFDHHVRKEWLNKIPAVVHLDQTARLQTVDHTDDAVLESILREYYKLSGIPVLCNTSANYNGCGFFSDITSAMKWGKVDMIWGEGILYKRSEKNIKINKVVDTYENVI